MLFSIQDVEKSGVLNVSVYTCTHAFVRLCTKSKVKLKLNLKREASKLQFLSSSVTP